MADSVSPECLDQEFYKEKSTNVALLGMAAQFLPSKICFFSFFDSLHKNNTAVKRRKKFFLSYVFIYSC